MANNATKPNPDLERLNRLVGTGQVSGDATREVTYERLEGKFFLEQCFDLVHGSRAINGIELIGHLHPFDGEPSEEIRTRIYSFIDGMTLDPVYELEGDTLMIWGGEKDSPMHCQGTFGDDGKTVNGARHWPGGGYTANMTRRD